MVLGAFPLPTDAGHVPIGVHHGGREFAAEFGGFGRDFDHPRFVHVGDPDADVDVVEFPPVVFGSRADGVGALGLEVEACALGHRELAGRLVDVKQLSVAADQAVGDVVIVAVGGRDGSPTAVPAAEFSATERDWRWRPHRRTVRGCGWAPVHAFPPHRCWEGS